MGKAPILVLLLLAPVLSGCLEVPIKPCEDSECFPLSNEVLQGILSDPSSFDVISMATTESKLKVESLTTYSTETQQGEIFWSVAKDDDAQLRSVAMRLSLGTTSIDTEIVEGASNTNIRLGNVWYEGRDAVPEYKEPFFDIAEQAAADPEGFWPSFGFDTTSISELDWTITGDILDQQQVATGVNETHTIVLEMRGVPPRIVGIELYGFDDSNFVLRVYTGDEFELQLQDDLPRSAIEFTIGDSNVLNSEITMWGGYVPSGFTSEVNPSELSFHVLVSQSDTESSIAEMNLAEIEANVTDEDGNWWAFNYWDYSGDGWFSAGDFYEIRTNSTVEARIGVWDHWASSWTGELSLPNSI